MSNVKTTASKANYKAYNNLYAKRRGEGLCVGQSQKRKLKILIILDASRMNGVLLKKVGPLVDERHILKII